MLLLAALLAQTPAPDIEVNVRATVREVRVRQRGEASLRVHASPDGGSRTEAPPPAPERETRGRETRGRNASVNVHAEARIADPRANMPAPETTPPN